MPVVKNSVPGRRSRKSSDPALTELETIFSRLRDLLSKEYERGSASAATRILHLVTANDGTLNKSASGQEASISRAPRGAARLLVEKALAGGSKTIKEIRESAKTDVEKFLSYQTVRLELERGKKDRRYKKSKDKWSSLRDSA